jgi:HEPN domain-containing protein
MVKSKKYSQNYAQELLSVAFEDLESAHDLQRAQTKRVENIFYLAQQAVEKSLKAILCWHQKPIPLVHDIGVLVTLVSESVVPPYGYDLNELSEFAAIRRYQAGREEYTQEEILTVLASVKESLEWAKTVIV